MASAIPLNSFKTIITNVTNAANTVYTCPAGVTTVVLLAQVSNVDNATVNVTAAHRRGANTTRLIANVKIPVQDAASLLTGKLVLETGDGFSIQADRLNAAELTLSILETANA
jgi:ABC-type polysaccharide transport system permease subunit